MLLPARRLTRVTSSCSLLSESLALPSEFDDLEGDEEARLVRSLCPSNSFANIPSSSSSLASSSSDSCLHEPLIWCLQTKDVYTKGIFLSVGRYCIRWMKTLENKIVSPFHEVQVGLQVSLNATQSENSMLLILEQKYS